MRKIIILIVIVNIFSTKTYNSMVQVSQPLVESLPKTAKIIEALPRAVRRTPLKPTAATAQSPYLPYYKQAQETIPPISKSYSSPYSRSKMPIITGSRDKGYSIFAPGSWQKNEFKPGLGELLRYYSTQTSEKKPYTRFDYLMPNKLITFNEFEYHPSTKVAADNLKKDLETITHKYYPKRTSLSKLFRPEYTELINNLFSLFGPQELPDIPENRWWWQSKGYAKSWNPELEEKYKVVRYRPIDSAAAKSVLELVGKPLLDKIFNLIKGFAEEPIEGYGRGYSRIELLEKFLITNHIIGEDTKKAWSGIDELLDEGDFSWDRFKKELNPQEDVNLEFINLFNALYKQRLLYKLFREATFSATYSTYKEYQGTYEAPRTETPGQKTKTFYQKAPKTLDDAYQRALKYEKKQINTREFLGLATGAPIAKMKGRYLKLAKRFHPDFFASAEDQARAKAVLQQLNNLKDKDMK